MSIEICLFIFGFLTILFSLLAMHFFLKSERLSQDLAIRSSTSFNINKFSLDEILSNSNVTSAYVNELLTKISCVIGKHEEAKTKISELELLAGKWETEYLSAKEVIGAYQYSDEQSYNSKQDLLLKMQRDSTTMFNLVDYLRKYSDVYSASELLDEWDRNQSQRKVNFNNLQN